MPPSTVVSPRTKPDLLYEVNISESEFQNFVVGILKRGGHSYWMLDPSRRAGIPDLMIVTKSGRVLFRELKRMRGLRPDTAQSDMMDKLAANGSDVKTWYPDDLEGQIEKELSE